MPEERDRELEIFEKNIREAIGRREQERRRQQRTPEQDRPAPKQERSFDRPDNPLELPGRHRAENAVRQRECLRAITDPGRRATTLENVDKYYEAWTRALKKAYAMRFEFTALPSGPDWFWEIKLDGYRAIAVKSDRELRLYSRNGKPFDEKFSQIAAALDDLADGTTVDGEVVALDGNGRPDFSLLQNFSGAAGRIRFFIFDLLRFKGRDLTALPLRERRKLLGSITFHSGWLSIADYFETDSSVLVKAAREQGLEGVVGKRKDSFYESGKRTGAWIKHRLNLGQEFVIGGFIPGPHGLDSIIVGYYRGENWSTLQEPGTASCPHRVEVCSKS
jgi:ATP-dependent DNA ligase